MPELVPIPKVWVWQTAGSRLRAMYGVYRPLQLSINHLPHYILPETFCKNAHFDVEFMIAMLQAGAWLNGSDWQVHVRYTIAKRLRVRLNMIFQEPFLPLRDTILDYQLNGGTFKTRDAIRSLATTIFRHPRSTPPLIATARLVLSVVDDVQVNTLIQPFHWIRAVVGASEFNPTFGMYLVRSEMFRQKVTLTQMLRAKL